MEQYQVERIKALMEAKEMTQKKLASICDISFMTVHSIINEPTYNPSIPIIQSIAQALGVEAQYIIEKTATETEAKSKLPINGFIEYGGTISSIRTFRQLEKVYEGIKYDMSVPILV